MTSELVSLSSVIGAVKAKALDRAAMCGSRIDKAVVGRCDADFAARYGKVCATPRIAQICKGERCMS
jgi:hypothetical protein